MKRIAIILATIIFGLLLHSQIAQAEIYKWVDEKGTVHFAEDPATIPERYREKVGGRATEEDSMTMEERIKAKREYEAEIKKRLEKEKREYEAKQLEEQLKKLEKEIATLDERKKEVQSSQKSGYVPFEKFIHIRNGMSEAEVLSRLGPPTREEITGQTTTGFVSGGTVSGFVSPGGSLSGTVSGGSFSGHQDAIKKYYYLGDFDSSEKKTVITFRGGRVIGIQRISSPHW